MSCKSLALISLLLAPTMLWAQGASPNKESLEKELGALEASYRDQQAAIYRKYIESLDVAIQEATKNADLKGALKWEQERREAMLRLSVLQDKEYTLEYSFFEPGVLKDFGYPARADVTPGGRWALSGSVTLRAELSKISEIVFEVELAKGDFRFEVGQMLGIVDWEADPRETHITYAGNKIRVPDGKRMLPGKTSVVRVYQNRDKVGVTVDGKKIYEASGELKGKLTFGCGGKECLIHMRGLKVRGRFEFPKESMP
jgi:hypothetical protein